MDNSQKITQKKNPWEKANFLSICLFWYCLILCTFVLSYQFYIIRWMNSLLGEGNKKELEMEDIFEVRKQDESEVLGDRLEQ